MSTLPTPPISPGTEVSDASGFRGWAEQVVTPSSEAELLAIVAEARANRRPLTVLGAGSGLTGASVAEGGWALSLERFRDIHIREIHIREGHASAGAAVSLLELNRAAAPHNQFYAPDPTEITASVGGTVSTNASGAHSFLFGSTRRHIEALRVALMDGTVREFRRGESVGFDVPSIPLPRTTKFTVGYPLQRGMDWIDLFCGAEGTLGIILEAELRLLPIPPHLFAAVIFFRNEESALDAVDAWRSVPGLRMMEYFDGASLDLMRSGNGVPVGAGAALLIDSHEDDIQAWEARLLAARALVDASWFAVSDQDRERFRKFRHALPERVNATMASRGFMKMGTDYAVPIERNREMLRYYRDQLDPVLPGQYVIYGHIGDAHLHVNMLPATQDQFAQADRLMTEFARKAAAMGGAVSAEHGLGKRKAHFLGIQYAPEHIAAMQAVKRRLDPQWLLGRGNLFPVPPDLNSA